MAKKRSSKKREGKPDKELSSLLRSRAEAPKSRPIIIESVYDHRNPLFEQAIRLYTGVFPKKERIDRAYFKQLLDEKRLGLLFPFNFHFLVAKLEGRVVGLVTGNYLAVVNMGFVGYLAVAPALKGRRVGSRLRRRLVEDMRRDARACGRDDLAAVLGEVEAENPWLHHLVRTRGAFAFDIDYRQPALRERSGEVPLVLYAQPIARPIRRVSADETRALLYAIYRRLYRVRFPLRNPTFKRILKGLEGRRSVGRKKLASKRGRRRLEKE